MIPLLTALLVVSLADPSVAGLRPETHEKAPLEYVSPVPGSSAYTFNLEYVSTYYVKDGSTGLPKADFTQDSDICIFDHRVVIYGVKLKWRESLGLDTTANLSDYKRALEFAKGSDQPAPRLNLLGTAGYRVLSNINIPDSNWG